MELLLIVIAIVCFVIAALPIATPINWIAVGLAFFAASHVVTRLIVQVQ
jgi:hypothetical protein